MKPNIVIFMTDQWRGDYTGSAGHPYIKTPNYDKMASEGMVFNQSYVTNPVCTPSRCSFCTGWYPHTRGHRSQDFLVDHEEPHLFSYLKEQGYHIAWGGKNDMLTEKAIAESVDTILTPDNAGSMWGGNLMTGEGVPYSVDDRRYYSFHFGEIKEDFERHPDVMLVRAAQDFLRNPPEEPYCLWINTTFPHPPYAAAEPFYSMYAPEDMEPPVPHGAVSGEPEFMEILRDVSRMSEVEPEHFNKIKALYCGMISMMDKLFGDLVSTMKETGSYDESAVFLTSDHGNYNGDYGLPEKWFISFHDAILRVPLAAKLPHQKNHGVNDVFVQHIDVFATILDLLDIQPRWSHFGQSLLPVIDGDVSEHRDAVYADAGANLLCDEPISIERAVVADFEPECSYYPNWVVFQNYPVAACRSTMIRTAQWKYIWRQQDKDELYDLLKDPLEQVNLLVGNLTDEICSVKNSLQSKLFQWYVETGDVVEPENFKKQ